MCSKSEPLLVLILHTCRDEMKYQQGTHSNCRFLKYNWGITVSVSNLFYLHRLGELSPADIIKCELATRCPYVEKLM